MCVCAEQSGEVKRNCSQERNNWLGSMCEPRYSDQLREQMKEYWRRQVEENKLEDALTETQGLKNHFWLETEYIDVNGQRRELTEQKKEELLKDLTVITNLKPIEKEWPLVDWREEIKKQITLERLRPYLSKLCQPQTTVLRMLLTAAELKLDPIYIPYLKRNVGQRWPQDLGGATILTNINLIVNTCSRPVQWESDRIFKLGRRGKVKTIKTTNWTLGKLAVSVVLGNNPEHIHHLWVEIRRGKREVEEQPVTVEDDRPSSREAEAEEGDEGEENTD